MKEILFFIDPIFFINQLQQIKHSKMIISSKPYSFP